jgi:hypothetical protein
MSRLGPARYFFPEILKDRKTPKDTKKMIRDFDWSLLTIPEPASSATSSAQSYSSASHDGLSDAEWPFQCEPVAAAPACPAATPAREAHTHALSNESQKPESATELKKQASETEPK